MSEDLRNKEGYSDYTAYKAIRKADGAEAKAWHTYRTILNVAKLAGFEVRGEILLEDRTGTIHRSEEIVKRRLEYERELARKAEETSESVYGK